MLDADVGESTDDFGDSFCTLGAVNKHRSKTPSSNHARVALGSAEEAYSFRILEHLLGVQNVWADALSRIWQPAQVSNLPTELLQVAQCHLPPSNATWWKLQ